MTTESKEMFVTTTHGMGGYFAVIMWWNPDMEGFWEPWSTGYGRFATREEAAEEAKYIAEVDELKYVEIPGYEGMSRVQEVQS